MCPKRLKFRLCNKNKCFLSYFGEEIDGISNPRFHSLSHWAIPSHHWLSHGMKQLKSPNHVCVCNVHRNQMEYNGCFFFADMFWENHIFFQISYAVVSCHARCDDASSFSISRSHFNLPYYSPLFAFSIHLFAFSPLPCCCLHRFDRRKI